MGRPGLLYGLRREPLVAREPWKVLFEWAETLVRRLGARDSLELREPYPASWCLWPAVVLYGVFVWVENVFPGSSTLFYITLVLYGSFGDATPVFG